MEKECVYVFRLNDFKRERERLHKHAEQFWNNLKTKYRDETVFFFQLIIMTVILTVAGSDAAA